MSSRRFLELVADGDAQTQNQQIQSLITQGVDAILVCAVDQNTIERALMAAQNAGIPVVAYDRDLPNSRVVAAFVGPDSLSDGREAGAYTAKQLKDVAGEKVIVELIGALNDQNGIDRSKGFREELAGLENVKLVEVPTDWDSARTLSGAQNAFQANPVVHAVYAATDTHIPSVETVLTDLGKLKNVGEEGHVIAKGQTAVDLAARLMNGENAERVNVITGNFYTTDNIEANKAKIWSAR